MGNQRVLPFLQSLTALAKPHLSREKAISHRLEHQLLLDALDKHAPHELVSATFAWVLHARQYSPHVQFHHSLASKVLLAFGSPIPSQQVFAVHINQAHNTATLLRDFQHVDGCESCPSMDWNNTANGLLPVALQLPQEIDLSAGCHYEERQNQVMIFADVLSVQFLDWLDIVSKKISEGDCSTQYLLRFWTLAVGDSVEDRSRPGLQGFIVKAALRSTEYKVVDDRVFSTRLFEDCAFGEESCRQTAIDDDEFKWREVDLGKDKEGKDKEPAFKGYKAIQFFKKNAGESLEKALELVSAFAEDTPSVVRSKPFSEFNEEQDGVKEMVRSVRKFREAAGRSDHLFINDYPIDLTSSIPRMEDIFHCLSFTTTAEVNRQVVMREEGVEHASMKTDDADGTSNRLRVDLDLENRLNSSLIWFNDLHNDSRYKNWPSLDAASEVDIAHFQALINSQQKKDRGPSTEHLRLAKVRAHHLSLVVALDAGDPQQFAYTGIPQTIVRSDLPIRIGLVLVPNGRVSSLVAAAFHYFFRLKGRKTSASFLQMIQQVLQYIGGGFQQVPLTEQIVEVAFQQVAGKLNGGEYATAADILDSDEGIRLTLQEARSFAEEAELFSKRTDNMDEQEDVTATEQFSLLGILNGVVLKDISSDVITVALAEQSRIATFLSSESGTAWEVKGVNEFEQWVALDPRLIVVGGLSQEMKRGDKRLTRFKSDDDEGRIPGSVVFALREKLRLVEYLNGGPDKGLVGGSKVTVWVVGANHQNEGFQRIASFVRELAASKFASQTRARFAVLEANSAFYNAVKDYSPGYDSREEVFVAINGKIVVASGIKTVDDLKVEVATEFERSSSSSSLYDDVLFIDTTLSGDINSACGSDMAVRSSREPQLSISELRKAIAVSNVSSLSFKREAHEDKHPLVRVAAVVNPFEEKAFVSCAILSALFEAYSSDQFAMEVFFIPEASQIKERINAPSEFSKFLLSPHSSFGESSDKRLPPAAVLTRLPHRRVLTVSVEAPRTWFVASHATNYDMDNIVLTSLPDNVHKLHAEYQLKDLIVEGSCIDEDENPPQGLKLVLENDAGVATDTLVMANLGYFQLRVPRPGRWLLRLAYGPSSSIFSLKAMEMYSGLIKTVYKVDSFGRVPILVESLSGARGILLRVQRKPGMEEKSVLDPSSASDSPSLSTMGGRIREKLKSLYKGKDWKFPAGSSRPEANPERINVFTVATGHLYERFMKIMMTSATKHASRPVKFWLLENYLSPSFKKMLPFLAKRLGCEIGMVTYKWPVWLRAQTEKQRIIWAYKILFLDVLFPLDVDRIIFVDSDQVIRGDLAELMDIDLGGAPYGYVPFCDSRKELESYRFWKTGFWKDTLQGAKYRISALYVVDLNRFRETAAGDTLRMIYQSLSADPNSLANLDQDLPNYASVSSIGTGEVVPIFDLPADWLWCETWCDDESKKTAKAIDLCNNPDTKEPKLKSAKRIIAEWVEYDNFASGMTEEIYREIAHSLSRKQQEETLVSDSTSCHLEDKAESPLTDDESVKIEL